MQIQNRHIRTGTEDTLEETLKLEEKVQIEWTGIRGWNDNIPEFKVSTMYTLSGVAMRELTTPTAKYDIAIARFSTRIRLHGSSSKFSSLE